MWHTNVDLYPGNITKQYDMSFIGNKNNQRISMENMFKQNNLDVRFFSGLSHEDMVTTHAKSKIGLNFSMNTNSTPPRTQMKARMFEVPAANTVLLTEYHDGIEEYFEIDKEILTFKNEQEMLEKFKAIIGKDSIIKEIAKNGYNRFIKEHESKVRLSNVLDKIKKF